MKLIDLARVVRSKNAGPTRLTIDVLFDDADAFSRGVAALTPASVAACLGRREDEVTVVPVPSACAVKIVVPRTAPAGGPFDADVYGAQQHGPLLELET